MQRFSIAAFARIGSDGDMVSSVAEAGSTDLTTLIKEVTAFLARLSDLGFSGHRSRQRRNDNTANNWLRSSGLYLFLAFPPIILMAAV